MEREGAMDENIRIEIHCINTGLNISFAVGLIGLSIWLACLMTYFSVGSLILFLVTLAAFIALALASEKIPTVVAADEKQLKYKHLFGWKTIELFKIQTITCEPFEVRGRYSSTQCIRLYIDTEDDECDLKQRVNTNEMLADSMQGKLTELPLMRVYEFIRAKTGK